MMRAIVVDDERLARAELRRLLGAHDNVQVVGEAADLQSAAEVAALTVPDVVFLDIQLGPASGFGLLPFLPKACRVIVVTAYDEYAVRAFEVNAVDYLLKPVHPERLARTLHRISASTGESASVPRLTPDAVAFLPCGSASAFLPVASIVCIFAAGDYTEVVTRDGRRRATLRSLAEWERRLPQELFERVHRSAIANLAAVSRVTPLPGGQMRLELAALQTPIVVSRRFARRLRARQV
jgi:two-component system, LytTR family, response regulator